MLNIIPFNWDFNNRCFTSGRELIHDLNSQPGGVLLVWFFIFDLSGKRNPTTDQQLTQLRVFLRDKLD